ncbi:hypothetical protein [Burkholderia perseverans]|uniref:hypothetical protein n=1 Tax=Burkholderia perseverans TaxID=2615214 RepID=UPI001FF0548C|nr:hypothetical protein [Burkholderia perseverans]
MSETASNVLALAAVRKVLLDGDTATITIRERVAMGVDPWIAYRNWDEHAVRLACWRSVVRLLPEHLQQEIIKVGLAELAIS